MNIVHSISMVNSYWSLVIVTKLAIIAFRLLTIICEELAFCIYWVMIKVLYRMFFKYSSTSRIVMRDAHEPLFNKSEKIRKF